MNFVPLEIPGAWVVELERRKDERGYFARTWCAAEFAAQGIDVPFVQASTAFNALQGTLRGMHYQAEPHAEDKLVRCIRGAAYVVVLDVRSGSSQRGKWQAVELSAENGRQLWAPKGCALGYQTLLDNTEIYYQMTAAYAPEAARGIRYDDPAFGISWPLEVTVISPADRDRPSNAVTS